MKNWIENIKWTEDGLVPVVVQDYISNKVIMFAWMNRLSLEASIKQKKAIYWSRSRKKIWTKGESSGYYQYIKDMINLYIIFKSIWENRIYNYIFCINRFFLNQRYQW